MNDVPRSIPMKDMACRAAEKTCLGRVSCGEGDSPILLRGLRKIGTVPVGFRSHSKAGQPGFLASRGSVAFWQQTAPPGCVFPSNPPQSSGGGPSLGRNSLAAPLPGCLRLSEFHPIGCDPAEAPGHDEPREANLPLDSGLPGRCRPVGHRRLPGPGPGPVRRLGIPPARQSGLLLRHGGWPMLRQALLPAADFKTAGTQSPRTNTGRPARSVDRRPWRNAGGHCTQ